MSALPLSRVVGYATDTRYLSLVGLTIIIYDTLLSFPNELYFVWLAPTRKTSLSTRIVYTLNRYGTMGMSVIFLGSLFPNSMLNASWVCSGLIATAICLYSLSCTSGNCLILHSLIRVSDCSKKVAWLMALGALTMHSITFVFTCIAIKQVLDGISFARMGSFEICALMETPSSFLGAFAPAVALDCYSFALLLLNALSRPRNTSQRLLRMLLKDGLVYFLVCLTTRILNIIMSSAVPTALVFVSWGIGFDLNAAVTARLYLRMCETDFSPNSGYASDSDSESSISSFIDSLSDEGGLMEIKD